MEFLKAEKYFSNKLLRSYEVTFSLCSEELHTEHREKVICMTPRFSNRYNYYVNNILKTRHHEIHKPSNT